MSIERLARIVRLRLRSLLRARDVDDELERELEFHVEALAAEMIADGMRPVDARRAARAAIGNVTSIREQCRDTRRVGWIADARQDAVYGLRMLRAEPGVTVAAVLSLAIGIGVTAAGLRGLDSALAGMLHVADADRYVQVQTVSPAFEIRSASAIDFVAWRDRSDVFDLLAASLNTNQVLGADAFGPAERTSGLAVTEAFFDAIGARPFIGRVFTREEARLVDPAPAAVISEQLWRRRFGSDPAILTRHIRVDGIVRPIVGVMPADIWYRDLPVDVWLPLRMLPTREHGSGRALRVMARLKSGPSIQDARARLDAVAASVGREFGAGFDGWTTAVTPLDDARLGWSRRPVAILFAIATLVLVVSCANVSGLLLARAVSRQREMRLRLDLGASRARLFRQWLTEGVVLGLSGGLAAVGVTAIALRALTTLRPPPGAPPLAPIGLDWRTAVIIAIVSVAAGLALTIVPAALAAARRHWSGGWPRARSALTAVQIAVTFVVVVESGLLLNSVIRLTTRDLGFQPARLLTFEVVVPSRREPLGTLRDRSYFEVTSNPADVLTRMLQSFREVQNVTSVGGSSFRAIDAFVTPRFDVAADRVTLPAVACAFVTPRYFETIGATIRQGREFDDRDGAGAPWAAIVNETAAAGLWPNENPIGRRIRVNTVPDDRPRVVVGVVGDIPLGHGTPPSPVVYESYLQQPSRFVAPWINLFGTLTFVVRYAGGREPVADAIIRAAAAVDPDVPLGGMSLVTERLAAGRAGRTSVVRLATFLAAAALVLALVGVHGVVAYGVRRQRREIAVRVALGARPIQVVRLIGVRVSAIVAVGLGAGVFVALPVGRAISAYLWGVTATDPLTFAAAGCLLAALALLASAPPVREALAVDAAKTLRAD